MSSNIDALHLRRVWGRAWWHVPEPFGPDGFSMAARGELASVIVTCFPQTTGYLHLDDGTVPLGIDWIHASIARADRMPSYEDLVTLHTSVWKGNGWAYQVFAPDDDHVNIHEHALHLWGRLDGQPALPNFGAQGTI